jgi:COMPASS component SWD3
MMEEVSKKRDPEPIQEKPETKRPKLDVPDTLTFVFEKEYKSNSALSAVKLSPNGKYIACATADNVVKILESDSLALCNTLKAHTAGISDVTWSYDSKLLASASDDKTAIIWDAATGLPVKVCRGHSNYVFCVRFNRASSILVSGSYDETVRTWDVKSGACLRTIPAHSDPVTSVDFSKDGNQIISGSYDGLVRIWDTNDGKCLRTLNEETNYPISYVELSPNCKYALVANLNSTLKLWNLEDDTPKAVRTYEGAKNEKHCHFAQYFMNKFIIMGGEDNNVYVWTLSHATLVQKIEAHQAPVICVSCNTTTKQMVTCSLDGVVKFWSAQFEEKNKNNS